MFSFKVHLKNEVLGACSGGSRIADCRGGATLLERAPIIHTVTFKTHLDIIKELGHVGRGARQGAPAWMLEGVHARGPPPGSGSATCMNPKSEIYIWNKIQRFDST